MQHNVASDCFHQMVETAEKVARLLSVFVVKYPQGNSFLDKTSAVGPRYQRHKMLALAEPGFVQGFTSRIQRGSFAEIGKVAEETVRIFVSRHTHHVIKVEADSLLTVFDFAVCDRR
jgi:hypothetical protein